MNTLGLDLAGAPEGDQPASRVLRGTLAGPSRASARTAPDGLSAVDRALEALRSHWDGAYALSLTDGGQYRAARNHKPWNTLCAPTPGRLEQAILADFTGGAR